MNDLVAKADKEQKDEEVAHSAYMMWCSDTDSKKAKAIGKANDRIEMLNADIQQAKVDIERLFGEIVTLDKDIQDWTLDHKSSADVRAKEAADFRATQIDYSESIDAIGRAIAVLKDKTADTKQ